MLALLLLCVALVLRAADGYHGGYPAFGTDDYSATRRDNAPVREFPSLLSLRYEGKHVCAANLLSGVYAVSAAHCFMRNMSLPRLFLVAGTDQLSGEGQSREVILVVKHPEFIEKNFRNDIALMRVSSKTPFVFDGHTVMPAVLPQHKQQVAHSARGAIAGWSLVKMTSARRSSSFMEQITDFVRPDIIQKMEVFVLSDSQCKKWQQTFVPDYDTVYCVLPQREKHAICKSYWCYHHGCRRTKKNPSVCNTAGSGEVHCYTRQEVRLHTVNVFRTF